MGSALKEQYLVRPTLSGLALLVLMNFMVAQATAFEFDSAVDAAEPDKSLEAASVQPLQQITVQQHELMAIQASQLERQQPQIHEQSRRARAGALS